MSTKLIVNGRVKVRTYAPGELRARPAPQLDDVQLERQSIALAEAEGKVLPRKPRLVPALPKELGVPWYDANDRILYRVLPKLDPAQGWGAMGFWMKRWNVTAEEVLRLARNNHMECATEPQSSMKRYRCLDESRTLLTIKEMKKTKEGKRK